MARDRDPVPGSIHRKERHTMTLWARAHRWHDVLRKWAVLGSNQRPPACKAGALPAELTARVHLLTHAANPTDGGTAPTDRRAACHAFRRVRPCRRRGLGSRIYYSARCSSACPLPSARAACSARRSSSSATQARRTREASSTAGRDLHAEADQAQLTAQVHLLRQLSKPADDLKRLLDA